MTAPNFVIFYVKNVSYSTNFYTDLLQRPPVKTSPGFAMFALDTGVLLGLWGRHIVVPTSFITGGGGELGFTVENADAVRAKHADWSERGITIAQPPTAMEFGYTFTALDPDKHRLRVLCPNAP